MSVARFRLLVVLVVAALLLLVYRVAQVDRIGDAISLGVLAFTVGIEGVIVGGGIVRYLGDPMIERIAQARAELELAKSEKARKRQVQTRGY